ncbi:TetR family transcriptional regulator [Pandoraea thiooxydans]|uniref:TetR family transcriptional regulator n=1 Tax=Pandoraea thiooxydans TaxID=445709 RepID=A0A0G3EQY7_9BURK|nr:TetR/AcrR family transcriptional regulator [Pandoraea thiooxydans]AKJ67762.1 TetR family transcriptional regulator [Pandoraea thiooxydans]APR94918.1 TetR family transcriptional regulator [Pandoraea thiooxydans]
MNATSAAEMRQHILDTAKPIMLRKGFTGVGLNEILATAGIPKGSFYHYFGSKEVFGEALLNAYFADYLDYLDQLLVRDSGTGAQRLMRYWADWQAMQAGDTPDRKCLVVKLGAEVCDLSEAMRAVLERGTAQIVERLARCIEAGQGDGSLDAGIEPHTTAATLYELWLGATLLEKIRRDGRPLDVAMTATRQLLGLDATS